MVKRIAVPLLEEKIKTRQAKIGVVGLGYVGLPLAVEFARAGFQITGVDTDPEKVAALNNGISFVSDINDNELGKFVAAGQMTAVSAIDSDVDVVIICVPTPLTKTREPDLSCVEAAALALAPHLRGGQLVILESTSYPGTTEEVLLPILAETGLIAGEDYHVGYSPERIDPGNKSYGVKNTPKVVSGLTPKCHELVRLLYGQIVDNIVPISSIKAAELTKLLENIFRTVNIALVNELAMLCDRLDINIWEIIEAAATKPFGFMRFLPGPGLGGHCLPVDPFYLSWKAKEVGFYTEFIELAGKTNESMPRYVVQKIIDGLNAQSKSLKGSNILILGVAYKANVGDMRESPALKIIPSLEARGATVEYHDPYVRSFQLNGRELRSKPLGPEALKKADCSLILTAHASIDYSMVVDRAQMIVDTRNALQRFCNPKIILL